MLSLGLDIGSVLVVRVCVCLCARSSVASHAHLHTHPTPTDAVNLPGLPDALSSGNEPNIKSVILLSAEVAAAKLPLFDEHTQVSAKEWLECAASDGVLESCWEALTTSSELLTPYM